MTGALSHSMVPLHEIISASDAHVELLPWGIKNPDSALPQIAIDDPALMDAATSRPAGASDSWPIGEIVRITRRSAFSGISIAYRVVVGTVAFPGLEGVPRRFPVSFQSLPEVAYESLEDDDDDDDDEEGTAQIPEMLKVLEATGEITDEQIQAQIESMHQTLEREPEGDDE